MILAVAFGGFYKMSGIETGMFPDVFLGFKLIESSLRD